MCSSSPPPCVPASETRPPPPPGNFSQQIFARCAPAHFGSKFRKILAWAKLRLPSRRRRRRRRRRRHSRPRGHPASVETTNLTDMRKYRMSPIAYSRRLMIKNRRTLNPFRTRTQHGRMHMAECRRLLFLTTCRARMIANHLRYMILVRCSSLIKGCQNHIGFAMIRASSEE